MFINIGGMMDTYNCKFEIVYGNQTQIQTMEAPRVMLEQRFLNYVQQAADAQAPIKVKISRKEPIWDQYTRSRIEREYSITFRNKSYENTFGLEEDGATP